MKEIEIHPGHWNATNSGANGYINEVTEARKVVNRVVELLKAAKIPYTHIEDNTSKNKTDNVNKLVKEHNKDKDALICSVHFNASPNGLVAQGIGTEVLYTSQKDIASKLAKAISDATGGDLKNRGAVYRNNVGVLTKTYEPAVLIEVAFVNSKHDADVYKRDFEKICVAIAKTLAESIGYTFTIAPPTPTPTPTPAPNKAIGTLTLSSNLNVRKNADIKSLVVREAKAKEVLNVYEIIDNRFYRVDGGYMSNPQQKYGTFKAATTERTYTVKSNDSLTKIAAGFEVTVDHLVAKNNIKDPNKIYVGQVLKI